MRSPRRRSRGILVFLAVLATVVPLVATTAPASAIPGTISTLAGTGTADYHGNCVDTAVAQLSSPSGIDVTFDGTVRFTDTANSRVRTLETDPANLRLFAGNGGFGFSGDGDFPQAATLDTPVGIAIGNSGFTFIADTLNHRVRRVSGVTITTVAGTGVSGFSGDGGQGTSAQISTPQALAHDPSNDILYIADLGNSRIRALDIGTGVITTLVSGIAATGLAFDDENDLLYAAEATTHQVKRITVATSAVTTIAGTGVAGFSGDNGIATAAQLNAPLGLAMDGDTHLLIADSANHRVRTIRLSDNRIGTKAGNGVAGFLGDGGTATNARLNLPAGVAVDGAGNIYIADATNNRIRTIGPGEIITTAAGSGTAGYFGDSDSECLEATSAMFHTATDVVVDDSGNAYISDSGTDRVRRVEAGTGLVRTIAGTGSEGNTGDGGPATSARLDSPQGLALDPQGDLLIADTGNHRVRRVDLDTGIITPVAGTGTFGFSGDGGQATAAQLREPHGLAFDRNGNLLIADTVNHRVRHVDTTTGTITTIAGTGTASSTGEGVAATTATLNRPHGLAVDDAGSIFVSEQSGQQVRRIDGVGVITRYAGTGAAGLSGDTGPAVDAQLNNPRGLVVDAAGNLYIADYINTRVRRVDAETRTISTVAGTSSGTHNGDGGASTAARINAASGLALDGEDDLLIAAGPKVREVEGDEPVGFLRATTTPAVPATITVDGVPRDSWGLTWLELRTGNHEVCFGAVAGFTPPPCEDVLVAPGQTTVVDGTYTQRGYLRVLTSPAVPSTISVDGIPRNDWGVWTEVDPGTYEVCYGAVADLDPPPCEDVVVTAGNTATATGVFTSDPGAPGPGTHGFLRATTNPATGSRITIDGEFADSWGLTWLKLAPGTYEVCFEDVLYATAPDCEDAVITAGNTAVVEGDFTPHGFLQISTSPAVPATIYIDGRRANSWGAYTSLEPGPHTVCYGSVPGLTPPPCEVVDVTAGATASRTGTYT